MPFLFSFADAGAVEAWSYLVRRPPGDPLPLAPQPRRLFGGSVGGTHQLAPVVGEVGVRDGNPLGHRQDDPQASLRVPRLDSDIWMHRWGHIFPPSLSCSEHGGERLRDLPVWLCVFGVARRTAGCWVWALVVVDLQPNLDWLV